ncbi:hypothetical protein HPB51_022757 [Rhipicephalus microplus]|uniref:Uncharacterized protein n=1 Tax=Rhipicephalus microplus TaxID=6941 RepID=A0A9J6EJU1_RHIMP|nr:hypothetical protein HPB51_022757 [Rhipicephalus microplus]
MIHDMKKRRRRRSRSLSKASGVLIQVEMKKALKEVYKDRGTAPSFIEENVKYRFESEDDGYQQVVKHRSLSGSNLHNRQTFHQERSNTGSEERSVAASQQYDITSWNKGNDASESSIIAVTGTERCGNEATTGAAWRAFINGWSSWTYERVGHDGTRKDASSSATLASCDHASTDTLPAATSDKPSSAARAAQPTWSSTLGAAAAAAKTGVYAATPNGPGDACELSGAQASPDDNL